MTGKNRARWLSQAALTASLALALAACGQEYPNTTFAPLSELAVSIDKIWDTLLYWGVAVFVIVEAALIYIVFRFRHRENTPEPKQIHGHTWLEVTWTMIPAFVLLMIAVPTVRTIFVTQADPPAGALRIDVKGHQWWWQFDYPDFGFNTANEIFLPAGRPVVFNIETNNVLHSFWIPRLAGKRDLVNRRVNQIWFTPHDTVVNQAFNGFCAEYCGSSHANMHFRVFVVSPEDFDRWRTHQASAPMVVPPAPGTTPAAPAGGTPATAGAATASASATQGAAAATDSAPAQPARPAPYAFPMERLTEINYTLPKLQYQESVTFQAGLTGDPARGAQIFGTSLCVGCHATLSNMPVMVGPNLSHVGARSTIAGGMYQNTWDNLVRWIKDAPSMKPGSKMPAMGAGIPNKLVPAGTLTDQQIADIAAYLMALK